MVNSSIPVNENTLLMKNCLISGDRDIGNLKVLPDEVILKIFSEMTSYIDCGSIVLSCKYFCVLATNKVPFDPNIKLIDGEGDSVFKRALALGRLDVLKRLIRNQNAPLEERISDDIKVKLNYDSKKLNFFQWAFKNLYVDIIREIINNKLVNKRFDPTADNHACIKLLLEKRDPSKELLEAVKIVLNDERIIPPTDINIYQLESVKNDLGMALLLFNNPRFKSTFGLIVALNLACRLGDKDTVDSLLAESKTEFHSEQFIKELSTPFFVDRGRRRNKNFAGNPIEEAVLSRQIEILKVLLADKRFPSCYYQKAFEWAYKDKEKFEAYLLLLADSRVDSSGVVAEGHTAELDQYFGNGENSRKKQKTSQE